MSSRSEEHVPALLVDVIDYAAEAIGIIGSRDFKAFADDRTSLLATERCVQVVTEAVIQLGKERMAVIAPGQPWEDIRHMGNMLRHVYAEIEPIIIFETVRDKFPPLAQACQAELSHRGINVAELANARDQEKDT